MKETELNKIGFEDEKEMLKAYKRFKTNRIVAGLIVAAAVVFALGFLFNYFDKDASNDSQTHVAETDVFETAETATPEPLALPELPEALPEENIAVPDTADTPLDEPVLEEPAVEHVDTPLADKHTDEHQDTEPPETNDTEHADDTAEAAATEHAASETSSESDTATEHGDTEVTTEEDAAVHDAAPADAPAAETAHVETDVAPEAVEHEPEETIAPVFEAKEEPARIGSTQGLTFIEACTAPIRRELNDRFMGYRPNDLTRFTDDVANFQLGVVAVTRATIPVILSDIAVSDTKNKDLASAVEYFNADEQRLMFPSSESKFMEGINHLESFQAAVETGAATMRTSNFLGLANLLNEYDKLLSIVETSLLKESGGDVEVDDIFYNAQGVASTMAEILEAVKEDFFSAIHSDKDRDHLHYAVEFLKQAAAINPFIVTDSGPGGMFANHRANLYLPLNRARLHIKAILKKPGL